LTKKPRFRRVLIKLSGEVLGGAREFGIDTSVIVQLSEQIARLVKGGVQVAIVVGGGNIFRGETSRQKEINSITIDRFVGDSMGILATIINALALADIFKKKGVPAVVQTSFEMVKIAEPFVREEAIHHLEKGRVVIFGGGTGNPVFTTDTASALRASEIHADAILKATKVDGVYDKDPKKFKDAKFYECISFSDILTRNLKVIDAAAISICRENRIPVLIFNYYRKNSLVDVLLSGKKLGTTIGEDPC
jgi:uridylate kinase